MMADQFLDALFTRKRWMLHTFFWAVILFWYVLFFGRESSNYLQTLFFVGLLMPVTIFTSWFLNYFLLPRYLLKERYWEFILYFGYTLIIALCLMMLISVLTFILLAEFNIRNMSTPSIDLFFLLASLLSVVLLTLAIKLLLHWRKSKEAYQKLMYEKVESELKFLKAQLNPHFLFNTLNNLYYLSTQKSDQAPAAILQLSEILDYSLYTSKATFVPMEKEWRQVENYIALETLHYEDRLKFDRSITGVAECLIAPMVLITLVENAFKHGVMKSKEKSWINLTVHCTDTKIKIEITNSTNNETGGHGGIGLQNLRSQLNLLYPDRHQIEISNANQVFSLKLELSNNP